VNKIIAMKRKKNTHRKNETNRGRENKSLGCVIHLETCVILSNVQCG